MDFMNTLCEYLIAFFALLSISLAAPIVKPVDEHPSTYRRIRMAHKFGIVAVNSAGKVYLSKNLDDPNTILILSSYGPRKHRIQGEKSGLNIAMNSRGRVYTTKKVTYETLFLYKVLSNYSHVFESLLYKGFFLGFNRQMLPKRGNRARVRRNDRYYFRIFGPKRQNEVIEDPMFRKHFISSMQG